MCTITGNGEDTCKDISDKDEEIRGERVYFPKTLTTIDVVTWPPINKNRRSPGGQVSLNPTNLMMTKPSSQE